MFKQLQTKFAILYAALFIGVLALISAAVFVATTHNVEHVVRDQLFESGVVFENLSADQRSRMQEEAEVLSRDFGFRAAVATKDAATVRSALDNLATRSGIDLAFVVDMDGGVTGRTDAQPALPKSVVDAVQGQDSESGVIAIGGRPYEIVATPILTPAPAGWVVFARLIGSEAMHDLTKLSTLPLQASVITGVSAEENGPSALAAHSPVAAQQKIEKLPDAGDGVLVLTHRLPALNGGPALALVLRCPLDAALRPFHALGLAIAVIGALSLLLIVAGSWGLARSLTRPIASLEEAARRLQRGEAARVTIASDDELARLGQAFNTMADKILEREASLTRALAAAEAANEAKGIFLANMNHEVRTPLNGVVAAASMMASTPLEADQRRMIQVIEDSGMALQRILNDVLDMVDMGSDDFELLSQPFNLNALLERLNDRAAGQAAAKGLAFRAAVDLASDVWIRGDERRIGQVLVNLLDNAVKFTTEGQVVLTVWHDFDKGLWRFQVEDTGVGFDPTRAEALFGAFHQVDGSMTRQAGGAGLGLSLARNIARAMGGDILGQGSPGEGAVFTFTVPLDLCVVPAPTDRSALDETMDDPMADIPPVRILLADDHANNRLVIEMILNSLDTEVTSVENGLEAVEAFKQQGFDAVLMDLQMPVMDGLTAIKHIRAFERESGALRTPILVISANVQAAHLLASAEVGADSHLAKPIQAPTLIQALDDHLSGRAATAAASAAV